MDGLERYFFSGWRPDLFDLLVVAAVIEYCDLTVARPSLAWSRHFDVRVAVHDPALWNKPGVLLALTDAASFLTADVWTFEFVGRKRDATKPTQSSLSLDPGWQIIMPYSDGLDSRAVAAITASREKGTLVRVRLGSFGADKQNHDHKNEPFAIVPYKVKVDKRERRESSARSRAFKFCVITGIAAVLAKVQRIIVTESGQGALGPVLAATGQGYPDYRVHPAFTRRMEQLFKGLFGSTTVFEFPRLWSTKGETLAAAASLGGFKWTDTRSCWQDTRQVAHDGKRRQCGICAACMLRRMSMNTAKLDDPASTYIWENLSATEIRDGAVKGFNKHTPAMEEYAIAGILHMDHLASMAEPGFYSPVVDRIARELARVMDADATETQTSVYDLLRRHGKEWQDFLKTLKPRSFVRQIALTPVS
jgi:7-cyano-7-deazaguanine synthase in queuosine biosynthesis